MKALLAAACAMPLLAACDQIPLPAATSVDYRPEEAGTIAHAMCLLGFEAVKLRAVTSGHHLVDAKLNGRTATFVLDTGANASVLDAGHASAFGLTQALGGPAAAIGLGGGMKASQMRIESLALGTLPIRRSRMMVADLHQLTSLLGPMSGGTIHGIIGQDVMTEHRAVIDVAGPILYLIGADEDPAPVPRERCTGDSENAKGKMGKQGR